jgi:hypothetical protein
MEEEPQINYELYFKLVKTQFNIYYPIRKTYVSGATCSRYNRLYIKKLNKPYTFNEYMEHKKKEYILAYYDKIDLIKKRIEFMDKIKKELIIYLSQPKYLIKYLENGYSVEDYTDQF